MKKRLNVYTLRFREMKQLVGHLRNRGFSIPSAVTSFRAIPKHPDRATYKDHKVYENGDTYGRIVDKDRGSEINVFEGTRLDSAITAYQTEASANQRTARVSS